MAGGDVGPIIKPVDRYAELIAPVFQQADIRFAQCERSYSKRGWPPQFAIGPGGQHSRLDPDMASIFKAAGVNVVSLTSNHTMEWGPEAGAARYFPASRYCHCAPAGKRSALAMIYSLAGFAQYRNSCHNHSFLL